MKKKLIAGLLAAGMAAMMVGCSDASVTESTSPEPTETISATAEPTEEPTETPTPEPTEEPTPVPDQTDLNQVATLEGGVTYKYSDAWDYRPTETSEGETSSSVTTNMYGIWNDDRTAAEGFIVVSRMHLDVEDAALAETMMPVFAKQIAGIVGVESVTKATDEVTAGIPYVGTGTQKINGNTMMSMVISFVIDQDIYQFGMEGTTEAFNTVMALWAEVVNSAEYNGTPILVNPLNGSGSSSAADTADGATETNADATPAEEAIAAPAQDVTTGMKNALGKGETYLKALGFSESGLRKQLEHDGFTPEEVDYAIGNIVADWNAEAVEKAESYMRALSLSRAELVKQLEHDGFTSEQAEQAVAAVYD